MDPTFTNTFLLQSPSALSTEFITSQILASRSMIVTCKNFYLTNATITNRRVQVTTGNVEYTSQSMDKKSIIEKALLVNYYENYLKQDVTEEIKSNVSH